MTKILLINIIKMSLVIVLLGLAAMMATPKGRLPLVIRNFKKVLYRNSSLNLEDDKEEQVPLWKRLLAFCFVVAAILIALFFNRI